MFEVVETFLIQFIGILPFIIPFILICNLVSSLLWGGKWWSMYQIIRTFLLAMCYKMGIPYEVIQTHLPRIVLFSIAITILIRPIFTKMVIKLFPNILLYRLVYLLVRLLIIFFIGMILIKFLLPLLFYWSFVFIFLIEFYLDYLEGGWKYESKWG